MRIPFTIIFSTACKNISVKFIKISLGDLVGAVVKGFPCYKPMETMKILCRELLDHAPYKISKLSDFQFQTKKIFKEFYFRVIKLSSNNCLKIKLFQQFQEFHARNIHIKFY